MRIEAHESIGAQQETADAIFALMQARHLCHEGKVIEALSLYDGIGFDAPQRTEGRRGGRTDLR
jgi:hypothetical protein